MSNVLIIDDDQDMCALLARMVRKRGHEPTCTHTLDEGIAALSAEEFDVVFLDVNLPDGSGLDALPILSQTPSGPEVIIITGAGDADGAALAIRSGAWDYIEKPASIQHMMLPFVRALQYREEKLARSHAPGVMVLKREGIVGRSPQLLASFDLLARAAPTEANILITGETGTGKELFALAVHGNSPRASRAFVVLDCSVLPETLVESLLFGHTKGAFTGADSPREGLIKQADGGTLFLDEVGELPLSLQKAFLRVLQERRFRPLGSRTEVSSDFRLVAATNRNLSRMAAEGAFRKDLLFRLRTFSIELPPLKERNGDIFELAVHHLARICERQRIGLKGFAPEFIEALTHYPWPGNVRELFHAMESAVASAHYEPTLYPKHLPEDIRIFLAQHSLLNAGQSVPPRLQADLEPEAPLPLREYREAMDRQYLQNLIAHTRGNMRQACRLSGLSRSRLYGLLKLHRITPTE